MLKNYLYAIIFLMISPICLALTFAIPKDSNIVGGMQTAIIQKGESLSEIGRRFDVGVYEMIEANPQINPWSPRAGTEVKIPTKFILPAKIRNGIVINLAEMRLYYFHSDNKLVSTYPLGIGRKGWLTPLGVTTIVQKKKHPTWYPPKSIRASHAKKGKILPDFIPPGPKNPLGDYAMKLGFSGYLIHGTNRPGGIGVRSSSGCIRMFPEDIESLFHLIPIGTKVTIIHKPYKVGVRQNKIYVESHEPLSDPYYQSYNDQDALKKAFEDEDIFHTNIDYDNTLNILKKHRGYPIEIEIN